MTFTLWLVYLPYTFILNYAQCAKLLLIRKSQIKPKFYTLGQLTGSTDTIALIVKTSQ